MSQSEAFRHVAQVLREAQRSAIEIENAPERRKRLRDFSVAEIASLWGVAPRLLRQALPRQEVRGIAPPARLTFGELQQARRQLEAQGKLISTRRDPASGEALATVVFTNFKGGSAKTTSSVHFAQYMALAGYRVLMVDLDSQGSASAQFGFQPGLDVGAEGCFTAWLNRPVGSAAGSAARLCRPTYWPAIDLVPASPALGEGEEILARRAGQGVEEGILYFDELKAFLSMVQDRYDIAVVDTRPDVNMLMSTALHAATGIIVPSRATMTDLASTGEFFAHLSDYTAEFQAAFGHGLDFAFSHILLTAFDPTDRSQDALAQLIRERFGSLVLREAFLHSRIVGTAGFGKETLYEYEPSTDRAAYNRAIASANAVNRAIEAAILRHWGRASGEGRPGRKEQQA